MSYFKVPNDSYGLCGRLNFIQNSIQNFNPSTVLDYGCGTGNNLTLPLANKFNNINFFGYDSDSNSINHAKIYQKSNLTYSNKIEDISNKKFSLIICSEVLEHVFNPIETLIFLKSHLEDNGHLILTTPNGYGPFEFSMFVETLFTLSGLRAILLRNKNKIADTVDTLAISPHINFFSLNKIQQIVKMIDFKITNIQGRTFLCGFLFDKIFKNEYLVNLNIKLGQRLPLFLVSGWILIIKSDPHSRFPLKTTTTYNRPLLDKIRAQLFYKRWNLGKFSDENNFSQ